jgi:hypothetical protein
VQQPEVKARKRVVIAGIAQIQELEQLLVDEEESEKSVILAGSAMQYEREVRRVSQCRQNMPWSRNQNHNQRTAEGMKPFPGSSSKELACKVKIDYPGSHRKYDADQALQQQPRPQAGREDERPQTRMGFFLVKSPQERPYCQSRRKGQNDVGNQNPRG